MATQRVSPFVSSTAKRLDLTLVADFPGLRVLAWQGSRLYASNAYTLLRADTSGSSLRWQKVGHYQPRWWRNLSPATRLTCRLFRDGFHALAVLSSGHLIAAVPGALVVLSPGEAEFRLSHPVRRGTRPLHIAVTPRDQIFWGEYFDNPQRDPVHIYASTDRGQTWDVAYSFAKGAVRHVHNVVYDQWEDCLWILTGDHGSECRILRTSCDFGHVDEVLSGNQQHRAAAIIPTPEGLYFSTDTPLESNHIWRLDRRGGLTRLADLSGSSTYGCRVGQAMFFSTMAEPSAVNSKRTVGLYGSPDGVAWQRHREWRKDSWPMKLFQYGNAFLPDGVNHTQILAITTTAVHPGDDETSLWLVNLT